MWYDLKPSTRDKIIALILALASWGHVATAVLFAYLKQEAASGLCAAASALLLCASVMWLAFSSDTWKTRDKRHFLEQQTPDICPKCGAARPCDAGLHS